HGPCYSQPCIVNPDYVGSIIITAWRRIKPSGPIPINQRGGVMDERELLLLGLLRAQSQHGYQINEFIEKNLRRVTDMKKATAYAILDRLARDGHAVTHREQEGNRPPR